MARVPQRKFAYVMVAVLLIAAAGAVLFGWHEDDAPEYRLARVERGPIISTVTASGTLAAVVTVQVGSQISGQLKEIYADFNSEVKAGELIARLDPATYDAKLKQAEANLALAQASVKTQRASVIKARASLSNTEKSLRRQRDLARQGVASASALDAAEALFNTAQAEVSMAEAQVENAVAQVGAQEALVNQARIDLERTFIRAPVDGTVISRDVDRGQTVAASLQAPILFKIAQDLRKMQVEVRVDEADVGRIQQNQRATFTVDSFPGREFHGQVEQIRKASTVVQNVVTYSVLVSADNDDLRLLPGLTANVRIVVDERDTAVKVANAALRFRPVGVTEGTAPDIIPGPGSGSRGALAAAGSRQPAGQDDGADRLAQLTQLLDLTAEQQGQAKSVIAGLRQQAQASRQQASDEGTRGGGGNRAAGQQVRAQFDTQIAALLTPEQLEKYRVAREGRNGAGTRRGRVWITDAEGDLKAIEVTLGITDGATSEVVRGDLREGDMVIVGVASAGGARPASRGLPGFGR
jgi:HlyD family secretion protein